MPMLSQNFLQSLGVTLDEKTLAALSEHFETTLEGRVVDAIVENLDEQQLEQLAALRGQGDDTMQTWLQANVPELPEIIQEEVDILLGDLAENSDQI